MKAGYARVSSQQQSDEGTSLENQIGRLKAAGAIAVYVDVESGRSDQRKEFNKMVADAIAGKIQEVIVTRLDRLGRSVITLHKTMAALDEHGVKLTILDSPIDNKSAFGWLSLSQMSMMAEFESRMLSHRIKGGMDYLRKEGRSFKPPRGYLRNSESGKLEPGNDWAIAKDIVEIYKSLGNLRQAIAQIYDRHGVKMSVTGLRDWLRNPALRGHTAYGIWHNRNNPEKWDIRHNTHLALISEEDWKEIEYLMQRGRKLWGFNANLPIAKYPLAGQIKCGDCGGNCYRYFTRKKEPKMRCRRRDENINYCSNGTAIAYEKIEEAVILALRSRSEEIAKLSILPPVENPQIKELEHKVAAMESLGLGDSITANDLRSQIHQLANQQLQPTTDHDLQKLISLAYCDRNFFHQLNENDRANLYKTLVDAIVVSNKNIEVKLKF
jgi:site-specific DNA recombinase